MTELLEAELVLDTSDALSRVEDLTQFLSDSLNATDVSGIAAAIESALEPLTTAQLDLDVDDASARIADLGDFLADTLNNADFSGLSAGLESAVEPLNDLHLELDVSTAENALTGLTDQADNIFAGVDTSVLLDGIDTAQEKLADPVPITVDTSEALGQIEDLQAALDAASSSFQIDTGGSQAGVAGLTDQTQQLADVAGTAEDKVHGLGSAATFLEGAAVAGTGGVGGLEKVLGSAGGQAVVGAAGVGALGVAVDKLAEKGIAGAGAQQRYNTILGEFGDVVDHIDVGNLDTDLDHLSLTLGSVPSQTQQAAATLFQMGKSAGIAAPQVAETTKELIALAARSVALNPSLGSVGEVAERMGLRLARGGLFANRLGVSLVAADINARALNNTNKETVSQLTVYEKTVAAAQLATEKYGNQLDQSVAKGAENPIIQQRRITAEVEHFLETAARPIVMPFLRLLEAGVPIAEAFGSILSELGTIALPIVAQAAEILGPPLKFIADVLEEMRPILGPIVDAFIAFRVLETIGGIVDRLSLKLVKQQLAHQAAAVAAGEQAIAEQAAATAAVEEAAAADVGAVSNQALAVTSGEAAVGLGALGVAAGADVAQLGLFDAALDASVVQMELFDAAAFETAAAAETAGAAAATSGSGLATAGGLGIIGGEGLSAFASAATGAILPVVGLAAVAGGTLALLGAFGDTQADKFLERLKEAMAETDPIAAHLVETLFKNRNTAQGLTGDYQHLSASLGDYIETQSRFSTQHQIDDLKRLGLDAQQTGLILEQGSAGVAHFFDVAARSGEITNNVGRLFAQTAANTSGASRNVALYTKALEGNREAQKQIQIIGGNTVVAYENAKRSVEALGLGTKITGEEYVNATTKQKAQILALNESVDKNGDLIISAEQVATATKKAEKATFEQFVAEKQLTPQVVENIEKEAKNSKGKVDYALATTLAVNATTSLKAAFAGLGTDLDVTQRGLDGLGTAIDDLLKNKIPSVGATLSKAVTNANALTPFGIDPAKVSDITKGIQDETTALASFFGNVNTLINRGQNQLAEALVQLGPDDLGARAEAALAANNPFIAQGWETALEGLVKGELVAEEILAVQRTRLSFLVAELGNDIVTTFAKRAFGKDLAQLTDQELSEVANHFRNNPEIGPAANAFLDAAKARFIAAKVAIGETGAQAAAEWANRVKLGAPLSTSAGNAIGKAMADAIRGINFAAIGSGAVFDFAVGAEKQKNHVADVGHAIGAIMAVAVRQGLQAQSPSKKMLEAADDAILGLTIGLEQGIPEVAALAVRVGEAAVPPPSTFDANAIRLAAQTAAQAFIVPTPSPSLVAASLPATFTSGGTAPVADRVVIHSPITIEGNVFGDSHIESILDDRDREVERNLRANR